MEKSGSSRREFIKVCAVAGAAYRWGRLGVVDPARPSVIVVGAGAFGGWSALQLLRLRAKVTLLDAWGPGNSRASSGGETRVIRATYGPARLYTQMAARALQLWHENEQRWKLKLFFKTGVLWMAGHEDSYERAALSLLKEAGVSAEQLSPSESAKRWPQIDFQGVAWCIHEPDSGYLAARRSCEAVLRSFLDEGGEYQQAQVVPGAIANHRMESVVLATGEKLQADHYVFACGPWLGKVFSFLSNTITPTRQEVFFFGAPAGDLRFTDDRLPVWIDNGKRLFYGIPGNHWRGFKIADDTRGPVFDPTSGERRLSEEALASAREYLSLRFPGLRGAPLLESRVCQYENSTDQNFILDRHPEAANVWIVGGGSGHGFKHGPVIGEKVANAVLGFRSPEEELSLHRLQRKN